MNPQKDNKQNKKFSLHGFHKCSGETRTFLKPIFAPSTLLTLQSDFSHISTTQVIGICKHLLIWGQQCYKVKSYLNLNVSSCSPLPADGLIRGTMTGALLCSLGVVRDEFVEEEEGEEEGTPEDSLSPLFMARTE